VEVQLDKQTALALGVSEHGGAFTPYRTQHGLFAIDEAELLRVDPERGVTMWRVDAGDRLERHGAVFSDSMAFIACSNPGKPLPSCPSGQCHDALCRFSLAEGKLEARLPGVEDFRLASPEGPVIVVRDSRRTIESVSLDGRTRWAAKLSPGFTVMRLATSKRWAVTLSGSDGGSLLEVRDVSNGGVVWRVEGAQYGFDLPRVSDTHLVYFGSGAFLIVRIPGGEVATVRGKLCSTGVIACGPGVSQAPEHTSPCGDAFLTPTAVVIPDAEGVHLYQLPVPGR
jgi:hypothetical protein